MNERPLITNIQRFSLHDGPGIRTTVFTKGCSLRCPWCSNPENMKPVIESYVKDGEPGTYGEYLSCEEIYTEVMKDRSFYGNKLTNQKHCGKCMNLEGLPGGVTFSGGEALLQADKLELLFAMLKKADIHMAMETCLFARERSLDIALDYMDLFYVDVKLLDEEKCRDVEHGDLKLYLGNLESLFSRRRTDIPVVFRIPVIGTYTDTKENMDKVLGLLRNYMPEKVELIKGHNLGDEKYKSLGMPIPGYREVSNEFLKEYKKAIDNLGIPCEICQI